MLIRRNWWLLVLIIIIVGAASGHNVLLLMGILLGLVGGVSVLWIRYCLAAVSYQRHFETTRLFYGEEAELALQVVNAKPLPLAWLITVDEFPSDVELLTGQTIFSHQLRRRLLVNTFNLRWYEQITRHYRVRAFRRGVWRFGPVQLSAGDIFGFSVKRMVLEEKQTIVVYPKMVPLQVAHLPDVYPFGDYNTQRRIMDDPLRAVGAREYVPGDSFRNIDWKATARRRGLHTKVLDPSAARPLALFLNTRTSEYADEGIDRNILELAVTAAASIARWAWERQDPVGLFANSIIVDNGQPVEILPGKQPDQLLQILEALARMEDNGRWGLATILGAKATTLPYGTTIVIITAIINERFLHALMDLQRKEYGLTVITLGKGRLNQELVGIHNYHIDGREKWHELETLVLA